MAGNGWSGIQEATGNLGEALMRIAMLSDDRRYRAEQLARQGRYDERAQQRIDTDEQMLAESVKRTGVVTQQGQRTDARAIASTLRGQADLGYSLTPGEGMSMEEAQAGIGAGIPQQWDYDPTQSRSYQASEAENQLALAHSQAMGGVQTDILGNRAEELGGLGLDVGGRQLTAPEAPMVTMNGREFPDTPEGHAAALAWREQVEAVGGSPSLFDNDAARAAMGGGGRPAEEGGNFFSKMLGRFGGGDEEEDPMLTPGQGVVQGMGVEEPIGAPGVTQNQIDQLREMGWTEDQIQEWLDSR